MSSKRQLEILSFSPLVLRMKEFNGDASNWVGIKVVSEEQQNRHCLESTIREFRIFVNLFE